MAYISLPDIDGTSRMEDFKMNYEEIRVSYSKPKNREKLLKQGFSGRGIDELMNRVALSDPKDREISAMLIGNLLA